MLFSSHLGQRELLKYKHRISPVLQSVVAPFPFPSAILSRRLVSSIGLPLSGRSLASSLDMLGLAPVGTGYSAGCYDPEPGLCHKSQISIMRYIVTRK